MGTAPPDRVPLTQAPTLNERMAKLKLSVPQVVAGAVILILIVIAGITTPGFTTVENLLVIVRAASITGIVALGMAFVTISGNLFAVSAAELAALLAVAFAAFMAHSWGLAISLLATLGCAILAGAIQGVVIAVIGNPVVTTIAFGAVFRGLAAFFSGNAIIHLGTHAADWIGTGRPLGIPTQSWAFVILAVAGHFVLRRARLGRLIVLSGASREAAVASGLHVGVITTIAMILLALGAAVAGIFTTAQFANAKPDLFATLDIDCIAAVLVGGISLRGGQGSPLQAALGAIVIVLLQNFMILHDCSTGLRLAVVGALVVVSTSGFHLLQGRGGLHVSAGYRPRLDTARDLASRGGLFLVVYGIFAIWMPNIRTIDGLGALLDGSVLTGLVALGAGLTMIAGELDLSVGSVAALSGIITVQMSGLGLVPAVVISTFIAACFGALQGVAIARLRINSLILTIGTLIGLRGVTLLVARETTVTLPIDLLSDTDALTAHFGLLSPLNGIFLLVIVGVGLFAAYTTWGREIFAIGGGRTEARAAGIEAHRPLIIAFTLSAALAGLAGALLSIRSGSASPLGFDSILLEGVTAGLIGGIALEGGRGTVIGIVFGVLTLRVLSSGLANLGVPFWGQQLGVGTVLIFVILVETASRSLIARRKRVAA